MVVPSTVGNMRSTRVLSRLNRAATLFVSLFAIVAGPAGTARAQSPEQYSSFIYGVTFGASHRYFGLNSPHPSLCADACYRNRRCAAWTYQSAESRPERVPLCHLHSRVFSQTRNNCCTSGVIFGRHAGPGPGPGPGRPPYRDESGPSDYSTFIEGVTLGVSNYRQMALPSPHSSICARNCYDDRRCVAWTYQRPESNGQNVPFCYLHRFVASRSAHPCCTSGWIRGRGARF
jgi:hypothetical protein